MKKKLVCFLIAGYLVVNLSIMGADSKTDSSDLYNQEGLQLLSVQQIQQQDIVNPFAQTAMFLKWIITL